MFEEVNVIMIVKFTCAGLEALNISRSAWMTQHAMPGIARLSSSLTALFVDELDAVMSTRCKCKSARQCYLCLQTDMLGMHDQL